MESAQSRPLSEQHKKNNAGIYEALLEMGSEGGAVAEAEALVSP